MNLLNMDIKYRKEVLEAIIEVYGEKHRKVIKKRRKRAVEFFYIFAEDLKDYCECLKECKAREFTDCFFKELGLNVGTHHPKSYGEQLNDQILKLQATYLGPYFDFNATEDSQWQGIFSFIIEPNEPLLDKKIEEQLKLLNIMKSSTMKEITLENYETFKTTEEYKELLQKINSYLKTCNQYCERMQEYIKTLKPYEDYITQEQTRKKQILETKKQKIYENIEDIIPVSIRNYLNETCKNSFEKANKLLGGDLENELFIEEFSEQNDEILQSSQTSQHEKEVYHVLRLGYFKMLGMNVEPLQFKNYDTIISQEEFQKLIPPYYLVNIISKLRKLLSEEAEKEYIYGNPYFQKIAKSLGSDPSNLEYLYYHMKKKHVCVCGGNDKNGKFVPMIFFSVRRGDLGLIEYTYLHEVGHSIESESLDSIFQGNYRTGLDIINDEKSSYQEKYRKYERMNETIRDLLTMEIRQVLNKKRIYIAEEKKILRYDCNYNTQLILKNILKPLLDNFREELIELLLYGDFSKFFSIVGQDNYEDLNDVINKVNSFIENGLLFKIIKQQEDEMVTAYNNELLRVAQIYENMNHQAKQNRGQSPQKKLSKM